MTAANSKLCSPNSSIELQGQNAIGNSSCEAPSLALMAAVDLEELGEMDVHEANDGDTKDEKANWDNDERFEHTASFKVPERREFQQAPRERNDASATKDLGIRCANKIIANYLMERVVEFQDLTRLRLKGWSNQEGDVFFEIQRQKADNQDKKTTQHFYRMMERNGQELHQSTGGFHISKVSFTPPTILDFCVAPGGFLNTALNLNRGARALGFSLPTSSGGHEVLLPYYATVAVRFLDITMLAADMGVAKADIPKDHADARNFLPQELNQGRPFDLIICDGQVLRTHIRAPYREQREATRLTVTQLALGIEHIKQGGTMVVLLHKLEAWRTVHLLFMFSKFSTVKLFKPTRSHAARSSFYMVATDIQPMFPEAVLAVQSWKKIWKIATFGEDEEYEESLYSNDMMVEEVLEEFGSKLVAMGREIWGLQAEALARNTWTR